MATSLDALNNVGPKYRYRVPDSVGPQKIDLFITQEFAESTGLSTLDLIGDTPSNVQQAVRPHTRKQYPGDTTTISVSAHNRVRSVGGVVFNNTLPGKTAYFGVINSGPPSDQKEIQFQFTGSFADLLAVFAGNLLITPAENEGFYLRSPNGVPKLLIQTNNPV